MFKIRASTSQRGVTHTGTGLIDDPLANNKTEHGNLNPDLSYVLYIDNLIGEDSINTMADPTLMAFMDHGDVVGRLPGDSLEAGNHLKEIAMLGVNLGEISGILLKDGLQAFSDSYDQLILDISEKRNKILV